MPAAALMIKKQDFLPGPPRGARPISDLRFSFADRLSHQAAMNAELISRLRRVSPGEELEIGHFTKRALTTADPGIAEAARAIVAQLITARDEFPLVAEDRLFAPRHPDNRVAVLESALEAFARAFALAAPAAAAGALESYRRAAAKAASHPGTVFSAAVYSEMAARLEEAQRYAAPLPGEVLDA